MAENLLVTRVTLPPSRYIDAESQAAFFEGLSARVEALPGVESVALANTIPTDRLRRVAYEVSGAPSPTAIGDQHRPTVSTLVAGPSTSPLWAPGLWRVVSSRFSTALRLSLLSSSMSASPAARGPKKARSADVFAFQALRARG